MNCYRFIPAGAGNTGKRPKPGCAQSGSSPRVRGIRPPGLGGQPLLGSSPRVRGIRYIVRRIAGVGRFIPAGAGNTSLLGRKQKPGTVHPRGCGEYHWWPGVWTQCRFIPAGAGNTPPRHRLYAGLPVHPRGCGEYTTKRTSASPSVGSSPRVRGILGPRRLGRCPARFIPAGAGNTPDAQAQAAA